MNPCPLKNITESMNMYTRNKSHIELQIDEWMKDMIIAIMKQFKQLQY